VVLKRFLSDIRSGLSVQVIEGGREPFGIMLRTRCLRRAETSGPSQHWGPARIEIRAEEKNKPENPTNLSWPSRWRSVDSDSGAGFT